jgi:Pyruvate/2-oxoacid:ferredoxin oxidoreductase delta subunit
MSVRKIIEIDEEKCSGCGQCILECAEGALALVDGKARLVKDVYCDGLGACLGECPEDALRLVEREAEEFDEKAVERHLAEQSEAERPELTGIRRSPVPLACGCPGDAARELTPADVSAEEAPAPASALRNWPVQLHLVPVKAPFFNRADLLIAADCAGFTLTNLHGSFLRGRTLIIACPKLDDTSTYEDKLAAIFRENDIPSITVLYMVVPCCTGLVQIVRRALARSGRSIPLSIIRLDYHGRVLEGTRFTAANQA